MKFLLGIVTGIFLCILATYFFVTLGGMPVAVKSPALPFEKKIARTAIRVAVSKDMKTSSPVPADEPNLLAGAKTYAAQCAVCHGHLGQKPPAIANAMFPKAPQLLTADDFITDDKDPVGKIHWKVKYGIRLTGMPAFEDALTETEMWQVTQLLHHADHLSAPVQEILK
jgi:mono/diheme cytochrome c family protein